MQPGADFHLQVMEQICLIICLSSWHSMKLTSWIDFFMQMIGVWASKTAFYMVHLYHSASIIFYQVNTKVHVCFLCIL